MRRIIEKVKQKVSAKYSKEVKEDADSEAIKEESISVAVASARSPGHTLSLFGEPPQWIAHSLNNPSARTMVARDVAAEEPVVRPNHPLLRRPIDCILRFYVRLLDSRTGQTIRRVLFYRLLHDTSSPIDINDVKNVSLFAQALREGVVLDTRLPYLCVGYQGLRRGEVASVAPDAALLEWADMSGTNISSICFFFFRTLVGVYR
jgi:hypothetical protein